MNEAISQNEAERVKELEQKKHAYKMQRKLEDALNRCSPVKVESRYFVLAYRFVTFEIRGDLSFLSLEILKKVATINRIVAIGKGKLKIVFQVIK